MSHYAPPPRGLESAGLWKPISRCDLEELNAIAEEWREDLYRREEKLRKLEAYIERRYGPQVRLGAIGEAMLQAGWSE